MLRLSKEIHLSMSESGGVKTLSYKNKMQVQYVASLFCFVLVH